MRTIQVFAIAIAVTIIGGAAMASMRLAELDAGMPTVRTPVLAELFTSEGCSSCPPADDLLRDLLERQPIEGVEVIAISEHVDYWNRLGWRDPFSSAQFSERQRQYASALGSAQIYTPQLIVGGRIGVVGNDASAVRTALRDVARTQNATLTVTAVRDTGDQASVTVMVGRGPLPEATGTIEVVVAVVEDGLATDVARGENARRRLRHDAVARVLRPIGTLPNTAAGSELSGTVDLARFEPKGPLRVVAFLQDRDTRQVLGVATAPMPGR